MGRSDGQASRCAGALGLLVLATGCERFTHAGEYEVLYPEPFEGFCTACPEETGLRHAPCPVASSAADKPELFVYVWRYYELGFDPEAWQGPEADAFDLGFDLDCSSRQPTGRPALCQPRTLEDQSEGTPWIPLPHGIDNALAQRILGPLYLKAQALGQDAALDKGINESIAKGGSSVLIAVENWNGTPNDPKVTARIVSVAGISEANGGPPRWDGNDLWDALSDGADPESSFGAPGTTFKSNDAYVARGTLVLDLRSLGVADLTVVNNGARLDMPLHEFAVVGDITETELRNVSVVGKWSYADMKRTSSDMADFLAGCDPLKTAYLVSVFPDLMDTAPDVPLERGGSTNLPCDAMSIGYGGEAFRAKLGGFRPVSSLPSGCSP